MNQRRSEAGRDASAGSLGPVEGSGESEAFRRVGLGPSELRVAVRDRYDAVAREPGGSFSFRVGRSFAEDLGYPSEILESVPQQATEAFTGVATPVLRADLVRGETVLDLGCGGGLDLIVATRAVSPTGRTIGVDMSGAMAMRARDNVYALGLDRAQSVVAFAEALPVADAAVDCVIANGILNLAPNKSAVLKEVVRVLRPGGRFVLAEITLRYALPPDSIESLEDWFR